MATTAKPPVLVVLQFSGGNDYMNTVVPYKDPLYRDYRPRVALPEEQILPWTTMSGCTPVWPHARDVQPGEGGDLHGVGYPNSVRSHFRSMDIWHTCEPDKTGTEGWLGLATRELDPHKDNIVTAVSFGPSMFRALSVAGVPVACVDDLETYGLLTGISPAAAAAKILERFAQNYSPRDRPDEVMKYLG